MSGYVSLCPFTDPERDTVALSLSTRKCKALVRWQAGTSWVMMENPVCRDDSTAFRFLQPAHRLCDLDALFADTAPLEGEVKREAG